jgi:hypothetical protein
MLARLSLTVLLAYATGAVADANQDLGTVLSGLKDISVFYGMVKVSGLLGGLLVS